MPKTLYAFRWYQEQRQTSQQQVSKAEVQLQIGSTPDLIQFICPHFDKIQQAKYYPF